MAELKTKPTGVNPIEYLKGIENPEQRKDSLAILKMMKRVTGKKPKMWGTALIGFGEYHYKYPSGREGDWFMTGFAPRKQNLSLYIMPGFRRYGELLSRLGKHKTGKGCLYIKRLTDIDMDVLEELVSEGFKDMTEKYG